MPLWSIAVLLLAGIAVGIVFPGRLTNLFGDATLYVFLPALLFEGSWQLNSAVMRKTWKPIATLAIPGVLVTAAIVIVFARYGAGMPWPSALLLSAILCATDPV